jgi:hypothetical protein
MSEASTGWGSPWSVGELRKLGIDVAKSTVEKYRVNERHLKRILNRYFDYYHRWRTHLSLEMDTPESRLVQPPTLGKVVEFPEVGGLHHYCERLAA